MSATTKTLALLDLFGTSSPTLSLAELTRLSGLTKPTVHRMMKELVQLGFVDQIGEERSFRLGPRLVLLAKQREETVPFRNIIEEAVNKLSVETGETVHASILCGDQLLALCNIQSQKHAMCVRIKGDEVLSFNGTSSGQAILAYSPTPFVEQVLAVPLVKHTEKTISDPVQLRKRLSKIRKMGVAISNGGYEADVHSHSSPIFGDQGYAIASISIAAPATRIDTTVSEKFANLVKAAAQEITEHTGGKIAPEYQEVGK